LEFLPRTWNIRNRYELRVEKKEYCWTRNT